MFESLRTTPPVRQPRVLAKFIAGIDYLVPLLDIGLLRRWQARQLFRRFEIQPERDAGGFWGYLFA